MVQSKAVNLDGNISEKVSGNRFYELIDWTNWFRAKTMHIKVETAVGLNWHPTEGNRVKANCCKIFYGVVKYFMLCKQTKYLYLGFMEKTVIK